MKLEYIGDDHYAKIFDLVGQKVTVPPPLENIMLDDTDVELLKRWNFGDGSELDPERQTTHT